MSYCKVGDSPTVYYRFGGDRNFSKVSFNKIAPIEIKVEAADDDDDDNNDSGGPYQCPPLGSVCTLVYSARVRFGDNYEFEVGQCQEYTEAGWSFQECYVGRLYGGEEFNYDDFAFAWDAKATRSYTYKKGVPRPSRPTYYDELFADGNGLFVSDWQVESDSCFPKGGDPTNCVDSPPPPPPPPPPDDEKELKLIVLYNQKEIWSKTGKSPLKYDVSCSLDECPPSMMKLKSSNAKGFCCEPCAELRQEFSTIKSLVRKTNG